MEVDFYGLRKGGDGSIFSEILQGFGFIPPVYYSGVFIINLFLLVLLITKNGRGHDRLF